MINYSYLRPLKGKALKEWHDNTFFQRMELDCMQFENAVVLPLRPDSALLFGKGGVIAGGEYVELSGIVGRVGGYYEFTKPMESELSVVYCGYLPNHWGHFLIEGVARLWYVLEAGGEFDKYIFIIDEGSSVKLRGNYKEFFELLGIINKIELVNRPIRYKRVAVPALAYSKISRKKSGYSEKYLKVFNAVADKAIKSHDHIETADRVFLSRSHFQKAIETEFGLEMMDSFFSNNGYKILYPESISLSEMICYLHNANIVAAESGTLPHNLLFAQEGKCCQIMERQAIPNDMQANVDIMKKLRVTYVDCNYMVYPVVAGGGPFFWTYNKCMRRFAEENYFVPPDDEFINDKYRAKCLKKYIKAYRKAYSYSWGFEPWMMIYTDPIYEGYIDSCEDLGGFLKGDKPFQNSYFFNIRHLKKVIRNLNI